MKLALVLLSAMLALACTRRDESRVGDASITSAQATVTPSRMHERQNKWEPIRMSPAQSDSMTPAPPAPNEAIKEPPVPSWVPDAGRLTIVQASDRDKNLGIASPDASVP
jgi:hypothetical protein